MDLAEFPVGSQADSTNQRTETDDWRSNAMADDVKINRAPVLTLWPAVVAERLGFDWEEALTLGRAVAGSMRTAKA